MDTLDNTRREMAESINALATNRANLEEMHGQVWDTTQLQEDFRVEGFAAPFVIVSRKSDNVSGSLMFQHYPRFYYSFDKA